VVVPRIGDLMTRTYVQVTLPGIERQGTVASTVPVGWITNVGHAIIKTVDIEIGGQRIDRHYGDWLEIWSQLTLPYGKKTGYADMVGSTESVISTTGTQSDYTLYIPLQFWFCRYEGTALPLIALQYHEVRITVEFETWANLANPSLTFSDMVTPTVSDASLYIDYIFLDTVERRKFAQVSHEYLIDQLQYAGPESVSATNYRSKLNFNHPVKELVWVVHKDTDPLLVYDANMTLAKLQLNGHDRFSERAGRYFNQVQPWQHHTNIPDQKGIYVYSFALNPEVDQPSGTANFSRIDNSTLVLTLVDSSAYTLQVYAVNYNVLRIISGMGGLAYAN